MNRRCPAAVLVLAVLGLLAAPGAAQAHPLGNFTTNQYAGLRVGAGGVDVDYLLDLAELPAYQARHDGIDADGDGTASAGELDRYAAQTCAAVAAATAVSFDGRGADVVARPVALTFPPGAGGLETLRLQCVLHADGRPADGTTIGYRGNYLADRIGWREVTAVGDRYTLTSPAVPATSISARLTAYPKDTPTSDVRSADLTVRTGGPPAAPFPGDTAGAAAPARGVDRFTRWFTGLVGHPRLTLGVGVLAFGVAFVLGGAHAVAPGHGKTIMAAYLIGARGRLPHALAVAGTVAVTHTVGVLALGLVLALSLQVAPQSLYDWLRLASGVLVAVVGAQLLRNARRGSRARRAALAHAAHHDHDHDHNSHPHDHAEPAAHDHAHAAHDHAHAAHDHAHAAHDHAHAAHDHAHAANDHVPPGREHALAGQEHAGHEHAHAGHGHGHGQVHAGHDQAELAGAHQHGHAFAGNDHAHGHAHAGHAHPLPSDVAPSGDHVHAGHAHPLPSDVAPSGGHAHAGPGAGVPVGEPHSHGGGRPHVHYLPAADEPFRLRTLLAMGFAGGLSPSPSAVVVLLGAAALGRAWYGVLLVIAYGIGLAAVLTGIGFALARWGERLRGAGSGRFARLCTERLPTVTAAAILAVGLGVATLAIADMVAVHG